MRIFNIQDTLLKIDLVQRLEEALLFQARMTQSEQAPNAFEHTRIRQERLDEAENTREGRIREEEKKRKEPFLGLKKKKTEQRDAAKEVTLPAKPLENQQSSSGHIIDIKA